MGNTRSISDFDAVTLSMSHMILFKNNNAHTYRFSLLVVRLAELRSQCLCAKEIGTFAKTMLSAPSALMLTLHLRQLLLRSTIASKNTTIPTATPPTSARKMLAGEWGRTSAAAMN